MGQKDLTPRFGIGGVLRSFRRLPAVSARDERLRPFCPISAFASSTSCRNEQRHIARQVARDLSQRPVPQLRVLPVARQQPHPPRAERVRRDGGNGDSDDHEHTPDELARQGEKQCAGAAPGTWECQPGEVAGVSQNHDLPNARSGQAGRSRMLRAIASICGWLKRQSRGVGRRSRVVWSGLEPAGTTRLSLRVTRLSSPVTVGRTARRL